MKHPTFLQCKKEMFKKILSLFLVALVLASGAVAFVGCDNGEGTPDVTTKIDDSSETEKEVDDRFVGVDYGGRAFRIYTSAAPYNMETSNAFIQGSEELSGAVVNDAVLERNILVEELLGVNIEFTQCQLLWGDITPDIRKLTSSGLDEFDLLINDCFDYGTLSIEGHFRNLAVEDCVFDFDRSYWYKDFMDDMAWADGYHYLLAGDYFIDVVRQARALLVNKDMYQEYIQRSSDELYDMVLNYEWTYEQLNELVANVYVDVDGSEKQNIGDVFGFVSNNVWTVVIPMAVSMNPPFVSRDEEGFPSLTLHEGERAVLAVDAMRALFESQGTLAEAGDNMAIEIFARDESLFVDIVLGMLEEPVLREMEGDSCLLPYPMLMASDRKYTTSASDITEIGAVPITSPESNLPFISTVVEVLNRETENIVMPKYFREELKIKLVDDEKSAAMIDIVCSNFDNSFILTFNNALGNNILQTFRDCVLGDRDFSVLWARNRVSAEKRLKQLNETFTKRVESE